MLEGIIARLATWLLEKVISFAVTFGKAYIKAKGIEDQVNAEYKAHNDAINSIKASKEKGEEPSEEQKQRLRETGRALVGGIFKR
jgi:hypothetical protein